MKSYLLLKTGFLALILQFGQISMAEIAYDQKTDRVYSKNAPKNINQDEYNNLFHEIMGQHKKGILYFTQIETASVFLWLRAKGSPAALRLLSDIESLISTAKKDIARLYNS